MAATTFWALALAFFVTVIVAPFFLPMLKQLKFGQSIREDGPKTHLKKGGTPTMGGIMILFALLVTTIVIQGFVLSFTTEVILLLFVTLGFGFVGFLDDFIKIKWKRNLGLTSKQKLIGQLIISLLFFFILHRTGFDTHVYVPGTSLGVDIGILYYILVIFMLVGSSNAVNLTDGLDGLLAGCGAIAFGAYALLAWHIEMIEVAVFSATIVGALLGFLVFNAHPAKVFMGDTGSLALGGAIAAIAIVTKMELILVIIGGIFVVETLSVIIQVISYKSSGKRIFKMSPLHHHFELSGWSEWRVVVTFWIAGLVCAVFGIYIEVWV